jgi:hypothetical protein
MMVAVTPLTETLLISSNGGSVEKMAVNLEKAIGS